MVDLMGNRREKDEKKTYQRERERERKKLEERERESEIEREGKLSHTIYIDCIFLGILLPINLSLRYISLLFFFFSLFHFLSLFHFHSLFHFLSLSLFSWIPKKGHGLLPLHLRIFPDFEFLEGRKSGKEVRENLGRGEK